MSFTLLVASLLISIPNEVALASTVVPEDGMEIITDTIADGGSTDANTDDKLEYVLTIDGVQIRYIEITEYIDKDVMKISTKAYNEENNEILQDFTTTLRDGKIVDQDIYLLKELPESEMQSGTNSTSSTFSNTASNSSLVTYLEIGYTKNFTTGKGTARYLGLPNRTASLGSSKPFNDFANTVDSLRATENGTIAGWLISAFSGGGLVAGKIISWATAKVIIKNIAGPVAVASNAWALGQWFYYYNKLENNWSDIPKN